MQFFPLPDAAKTTRQLFQSQPSALRYIIAQSLLQDSLFQLGLALDEREFADFEKLELERKIIVGRVCQIN